MRNYVVLFPVFAVTLATLATLGGCNSNTIQDAKAPLVAHVTPTASPVPSPAPSAPAPFAMPAVKYPAAAVFEGGAGDINAPSEHKAIWRLYICMKKTTAPISGEVKLDFAQLGQKIEQTYDEVDTHAHLFTERMQKVDIKYTYTESRVSSDPAQDDGYASGAAHFSSQGDEQWITTDHRSDYDAPDHIGMQDTKIFDLNVMDVFQEPNRYVYNDAAGATYYLASWVERFSFDDNTRSYQLVEKCEERDQASFVLTGNDLAQDRREF